MVTYSLALLLLGVWLCHVSAVPGGFRDFSGSNATQNGTLATGVPTVAGAVQGDGTAVALFALETAPQGFNASVVEDLEFFGQWVNLTDDVNMTVGAEDSAGSGHRQGPVLTLYHQTSRELAGSILREGFKAGRQGWCGGGIYFAMSPQATFSKAIGPDSHKGFIIEARVDVGRIMHMSRTCDRHMTGAKLRSMGYDSINFNPGDGDEYVVYSPSRVLSTRGLR